MRSTPKRRPPASPRSGRISPRCRPRRSWSSRNRKITVLSGMWFEAARLAGFDVAAVIAVRHPQEVIASLAADRRTLAGALECLVAEIQSAGRESTRAAVPRVFVEYANLLDDWRREVKRISAALAIDLNTAG